MYSVIRTINALRHKLDCSSEISNLFEFENYFRLMSVGDEVVIANVLMNNILFSLELNNCNFKIRSSLLCCAIVETAALKKLIIPFNRISDSIDSIKKIISENKSIELLDLSGGYLTDEDFLFLSSALIENNVLSELLISGNSFTEKTIDTLCAVLMQNKVLRTVKLNERDFPKDKIDIMNNLLSNNIANASDSSLIQKNYNS
jgi:hypothetical protein